MKLKEGVSLQGLKIQMRPALIHADRIWEEAGQELVVTSGTEDFPHSPGSLHYYGYALDFRTNYFTEKERYLAYSRLTKHFNGRPYTIILHNTHIHIEYTGIKNNEK